MNSPPLSPSPYNSPHPPSPSPDNSPHPLSPSPDNSPHPPSPSPEGEGVKELLISLLAPLLQERGWGEAYENERGWG